MHSVNRYNTNDVIQLLKLIKRLLDKLENEENEQFRELEKLLKEMAKDLKERHDVIVAALKKTNDLLTDDIKPKVLFIEEKCKKTKEVVDAIKTLIETVRDGTFLKLKRIIRLLGGVSEDDNAIEESECKKLITQLGKDMAAAMADYHDQWKKKVDGHVENLGKIDNTNTDNILNFLKEKYLDSIKDAIKDAAKDGINEAIENDAKRYGG